jgi:hypothetical protein
VNQDELRQDRDEWRWRVEHALTGQRKSWWPRVVGRIGMGGPERLTYLCDKALRSSGLGLILRILVVVFVGLLFWQAVLAPGKP